jgi:hypothetical protein
MFVMSPSAGLLRRILGDSGGVFAILSRQRCGCELESLQPLPAVQWFVSEDGVVLPLGALTGSWIFTGKAAEAELKALTDQGFNLEDSDLIRHNVVVFR